MKFYLIFHLIFIISNTKGNAILQFKENICQLIYNNAWNLIY